jgi:hypothetical protein
MEMMLSEYIEYGAGVPKQYMKDQGGLILERYSNRYQLSHPIKKWPETRFPKTKFVS